MGQDQIHAGFTSSVNATSLVDELDYGNKGTPCSNQIYSSQVCAGSSTDLTQSPLSSELGEDELLSQFYQESFAIHEEVASSDVTGHGLLDDTSFGTSFEDTLNSLDVDPPCDAKADMARTRLMASLPRNLNNLPNAVYLQSITPQTVTVNLVVGIISILPPREITTRRGGRTVHLVEMLVGDDTRAGFAINIWLPDLPNLDRTTASDQELATAATQLRPRDMVLIRNAALSSFRGKVYGQSLRKGMTTIDLLHRIAVDSTDRYGAYSAQELRERFPTESPLLKVKRVKQWVMDFVGATTPQVLRNENSKLGGGGGGGKREREEAQLAPLPMDTQ